MSWARWRHGCSFLLLTACGPTRSPEVPEPIVVDTNGLSSEPALTRVERPEMEEAPTTDNPVPVDPDDAIWGPSEAPVTIVWFTDFQDPFCARVLPTLARLLESYGSDLRIVVKHYPLPFHKLAHAAALAGEAVRDRGGDSKFVRYFHLVYDRQRRLMSVIDLITWAQEVGVDVRGAFTNDSYDRRIDGDTALAKELDLRGVPAFRINGLALSGAQSFETFKEMLDGELVEAKKLEQRGVPWARIYDQRVAANFQASPDTARHPPEEDRTAYQVPVGTSPVAGPADALVTIIEFAGYQCPFCGRVQPTLRAVQKKYGADVRIVFKHNPLPFHKNSRPAAKVAIEVYDKLGQAAFWRFTEQLFDHQTNLSEPELYRLGVTAGLKQTDVKAALASQSHDRTIQTDQELAMDFKARGTPHFFVNGVRLSGAQPIANFEELVDRELEKARALVKRGVPRGKVYEEIMKSAQPPLPPETKPVAPVKAFQPRLGSPRAPVTIELFADLECPFCARLFPTVIALEKKYSGRLQIVWFDLPLPFHKNALRNAQVAYEIKRQRGDAGFWKFVEGLYQDFKVAQGADPPIVALAQRHGANGALIRAVIKNQKYAGNVEYGEKVARALGISGTPASIINGYYVSGAQPQRKFERLIERALKDHQAGKKPKQLDPARIK